jgi:hypothetical protein
MAPVDRILFALRMISLKVSTVYSKESDESKQGDSTYHFNNHRTRLLAKSVARGTLVADLSAGS